METLKTAELLMIVGRGTQVNHGVVQLFSFLLVMMRHCNEKSGKRLGPMSCCRYVPDRYFGRSREETGMSFQEKPNLLGVNLLFRDNLGNKRLIPK